MQAFFGFSALFLAFILPYFRCFVSFYQMFGVVQFALICKHFYIALQMNYSIIFSNNMNNIELNAVILTIVACHKIPFLNSSKLL